jgi:hypothetical protein
MQLSLLDIYNQMGNFAKGIVYVLAIMSIWSLSVAIKKWWDLRQAQGETRKFAPEFSQFLEKTIWLKPLRSLTNTKSRMSHAFSVELLPRFVR